MTSPHAPSTIAWAGTPGYRVCVALSASSPAEMIERAHRVLAEHLFVELRLDALAEPLQLLPALGALLQAHPHARLLATCRRTQAGGEFDGTVEEELRVLAAAAHAGCSLVDLELESAEQMHLEQHRRFREALAGVGSALLVSYHDYQHTRDLDLNLLRLLRHSPDIVKLVATANSLADSLAMLRLVGRPHTIPVVGIAMGEAGILSRVLGPRFGALFTFASAGADAATAPGQISASMLRDLYRIGHISAATRIYGVAGRPIAQSLSPLLHNTAFHAKGHDAVFLPLSTDSAEDLLRTARELPIEGLSVTMPLKQVVLPLLDAVDPLARRVGACNTVVRTLQGELHGYNTDVAGVTVPLERRLGSLQGARVLVRGAGGAARAAVFGLRDQGAEVWISNRTLATAVALAAEAGAQVAEPSMLADRRFDVLVNATPSGMDRGPTADAPSAPANNTSLALDHAPLPAPLIFDMVYRPLKTPLIRAARAQGLAVITGEEMFVHQGARQFELWTGEAAPEAEMLRVVLEALGAGIDPADV